MSAKNGLVTNGYHVWETEAQSDEATCPGSLSLLQKLSRLMPGALEVTQMEKAVGRLAPNWVG